jgi:hypothetical protein
VHAHTEDKSNDKKDSFYKKLEHIFDQFPMHHMKILFTIFSTKEEGTTISDQQSEMRICMKYVMIIGLEYKICHIMNGDNVNCVKSESSKTFRGKKSKYLTEN